MPVDADFDSWWREHDYFPSGLDRMSHPLLKPYRKLYNSHVKPEDLTLIEKLRLYLQAYRLVQAHMDLTSKRKSKKTVNRAVLLKKNERLFKDFGHIVAVEVWREVLRKCGSLKLGEALALEANMENVVDQAFQEMIALTEEAIQAVKAENPKDAWKEIVRLVTPHIPKLNRLLLKYYPGPFRSRGRTPELWSTFILLAMVNYLEQKTRKPHYREAVDIVNAQVPRLKSNDKLSYGSARARVTQFKQEHPDWKSDVKALYLCIHQFTDGDAHSVPLHQPTC